MLHLFARVQARRCSGKGRRLLPDQGEILGSHGEKEDLDSERPIMIKESRVVL